MIKIFLQKLQLFDELPLVVLKIYNVVHQVGSLHTSELISLDGTMFPHVLQGF